MSMAMVPVEVAPPNAALPTKTELDAIQVIAKALVEGAKDLIPAGLDTPGKVMAVILKGQEVGLGPMASLQHIFVVNGKPELDAQAMEAIVMARDPSARFEIKDTGMGCTVRLSRAGHASFEITYTYEDAKAAGQLKKPTRTNKQTGQKYEYDGPWQLYPKDMLRWAAVKRACRFGAPDLINALTITTFGGEYDERFAEDANGSEEPIAQAQAIAEPPPKPQPPEEENAFGTTERNAEADEVVDEETGEILKSHETPQGPQEAASSSSPDADGGDDENPAAMTKAEFFEAVAAIGLKTPRAVNDALGERLDDWLAEGRSYDAAYRAIIDRSRAPVTE